MVFRLKDIAEPRFLVRRRQLLWLSLLLVMGCASVGTPVVSDHSPVFGARPASYQVNSGDTLYSIAWRYGLDVAELASLNNLRKPFTIYPKQHLSLQPAARRIDRPTTQKPKTKLPTVRSPKVSATKLTTTWSWPVKVSPLLGFGERGSSGISRGTYYELPNLTTVRAAADGKVVYAGPGLGGYEHLIILEHDQGLLSAYGFHGQSKVKEQEIVKVATQLADTVGSSAKFSRFHFEVRKHGRPIDPKRLILSAQ